MERIPGYDDAPSFSGEGRALPAGRYVCVIKDAKEVSKQSGNKMLAVLFDIDEGDYKGFYDEKYRNDCASYGTGAKWGGVFRQGYKNKQLPFFKGLITSIEESNPGYKWDWNERGLKGKKIGFVFGREQFMASDGSVKWATKPIRASSLQRLANAKIPEDKKLPGAEDTAGFSDIEVSEDDLPF